MSAAGTRRHDAGLRAVERVRGVRERDSRLDVGDAVRERARAQARVALITEHLTRPLPSDGPAREVIAARAALVDLQGSFTDARRALADAEDRAADAIGRWSAARADLTAVEQLLERRARARAEERRRREALELDDVAGRLWLRSRTASAPPGGAA